MTADQIRQRLAAWRPGIPIDSDPELSEALHASRQDPSLAPWLHQQQAFHAAMARALREQPVPANLAERILAARKTVRPSFRIPPFAWAAAATAAVLLLGLLLRPFWPGTAPRADDYPTFRNRMVRSVVREYRMDLVTNNLAAIRGFMAQRAAPADFELPSALASLTPMGGGLLSWQGRKVSMVCLNGGPRGTLFLFVVPADSVASGRPQSLESAEVSRLATVAWTARDHTYVLAAHTTVEDLRRLVGTPQPL